MQITLETDYAIRIVLCLASHDKRMDAKAISECTNVSLRFALKILRNLVSSGVITSFKGVHGGYILAKPADEITLKDIIDIEKGPYKFSRCLNDDFECPVKSDSQYPCACHSVFNEISDYVNSKLDSTTIAMLIKPNKTVIIDT